MRLPVYLDYNATTPVDSRVLETMLPWFSEHFGNAASRTHLYGWTAEEAVTNARKQVAKFLNVNPKEVVFTSGATEANNLAIKGLFEKKSVRGKHIITVATEHKAILDTCHHLEEWGAEVTYLVPSSDGLISLQQLANVLRKDTILVSVMYANNEIGVIQPIREMATLAHSVGAVFHSDATQAVGKVTVDMHSDGIDLLSLSAHKLYGPKGIGALIVKQGIEISQQLDGGGHERGRRSGTLNVPGIVGLGKACEIAQKEMKSESERLKLLRDRLEQGILSQVPHTFVNGNIAARLPHLTNICFEDVDGENLLLSLKDVAVSTGSACTSASVLPSYVLKVLGLTDDQAYASLRLSLGRFTTDDEITFALQHIKEVVEQMRVGSLM
ncbi:IscS subfamily cysteine desulfurase [Runella sp. MFBS21]|uniref:cysteine desulfurase family protein n=1 Tax=Runella sp. MFBS21 TaxID=3034018 RepID=UPI0023F845D8|nr:IscS subfamily cysteine desulfurase [Runella sp. MFBS21]MDF7819273.1 IscS subfamily cysteine desulfurase [Runella sp. MFBS21]